MKRSLRSLELVATVATVAIWWSCEKKEEKSDESGTEPTTQAGTVALTDDLASSYPEGLSVTAFPVAVDESPGTAAAGTVAVPASTLALIEVCPPPPEPMPEGCVPPEPNGDAAGDGTGEYQPFVQHPKDQLEANKERLDGTATNCIDSEMLRALTREVNIGDVCYGFDYGMASGEAMGDADPGQVNGVLNNLADQSLAGVKAALQTVNGLVADTSKEACMVKVGRQMIDKSASRVEGTLRAFEGMLCQAKKDKIAEALPAVGETLDLKAAFSDLADATFSEATVTRLADRDGRPIYRSKLAFAMQEANGGERAVTVNLVHSPSVDNNIEYDGVMWFQSPHLDSMTQINYESVTSITYSKTGTTVSDQRLRMELRNADFNKDKVTAAVVANDGTIDMNAGADAQGNFGAGEQNQYVQGLSYFAFDINPSSYAGNIAFWKNPGGNYEESARGFLFESTQDETDGTLSGCAYSGAARSISIRKAIREGLTLEPTGCYTPQLSYGACGNGNDNVGSQIWKQCFKQGADGYYLVDSTKVTSTEGFDIIDLQTEAPALPVPEKGTGSVGEVNQ